jgi:hypothetical protein
MNPQDPSKEAAVQHQPQHDRPFSEQPHPTANAQASHQPAEQHHAAMQAPDAPEAPQAVSTAPEPQYNQEPERPLYHPEDDSPAAGQSDDETESGAYSSSQPYGDALPDVPGPEPHPHHNGSIEWTASEFIAHEKDTTWFIGLAGVTIAVALVIFLMTRDKFSTFIVCVAGILFGVVAHRPPRQMRYVVDDHGVTIGAKTYPYADFRSFSVVHEGPLKSITFMPLKRFMPPMSMYYDPADEDKIAEILSGYLPMQDHPNDPIEKLMKLIRF